MPPRAARLFSAVQFCAVGRIPPPAQKTMGFVCDSWSRNAKISTRKPGLIGGHQPREGPDNAGPSGFLRRRQSMAIICGISLNSLRSASATNAVQHGRIKAAITIADSEDCRPELLDVAALNESAVGCVQLENAQLNRTVLWTATAR